VYSSCRCSSTCHRLVRLRRLLADRRIGKALLVLPQGVILLSLGLSAVPWLLWLDAQFDMLFLGPTRNAKLRQRVERLTVTRADTVDAQAAELRRIERDLHDGAQARLVSLSMTIGWPRS
jgi:signal transduction histidine kinase